MAVTPVRTGPLPISSLPSPEISVVWPTSTPFTSVMALLVPGVPSNGTPRSRARGLGWAESVVARAQSKMNTVRRTCVGNMRPPAKEEVYGRKEDEVAVFAGRPAARRGRRWRCIEPAEIGASGIICVAQSGIDKFGRNPQDVGRDPGHDRIHAGSDFRTPRGNRNSAVRLQTNQRFRGKILGGVGFGRWDCTHNSGIGPAAAMFPLMRSPSHHISPFFSVELLDLICLSRFPATMNRTHSDAECSARFLAFWSSWKSIGFPL